jgi:hypothetical protein
MARTVPTVALTLTAVLFGGSAAAAADPRAMRDLVKLPAADLEALYLAAPPAQIPSGYVPGRAIRPARFPAANSRLTRLVWQGKVFRDDGTMVNRVFGGARAIPADVYYGDSLLDGKPSLVLDYSRSKLWPHVRDELREVSPGLYLGVMFDGQAVVKQKMFFTLDARK